MSRRLLHYRDGKSVVENHGRAVSTGRMQMTTVTRRDENGYPVEWRKSAGVANGAVCSLPMKAKKAARIYRLLPHLAPDRKGGA